MLVHRIVHATIKNAELHSTSKNLSGHGLTSRCGYYGPIGPAIGTSHWRYIIRSVHVYLADV